MNVFNLSTVAKIFINDEIFRTFFFREKKIKNNSLLEWIKIVYTTDKYSLNDSFGGH